MKATTWRDCAHCGKRAQFYEQEGAEVCGHCLEALALPKVMPFAPTREMCNRWRWLTWEWERRGMDRGEGAA